MKKTLTYPLIAFFALILIVSSCTKKTENAGEGTSAPAATNAKAPEKNITIGSVGETMAYDKTDLYVKSGDQVTLTFNNASTTLEHNWVLVKP